MTYDEQRLTIQNVISDLEFTLSKLYGLDKAYKEGRINEETYRNLYKEQWIDAQLAAEYIYESEPHL